MRIRVWSWREAMAGVELDRNYTEDTGDTEKTETQYCGWSSERGFPGVVARRKAVWQIPCGLWNAKKNSNGCEGRANGVPSTRRRYEIYG